MLYILNESTIPALKERLMAQSDLKVHQIYPNIIDLNINDFIVNEEIILHYSMDQMPLDAVEKMVDSFKAGMAFAPLVVDKNNYLVDGYHRYLACLQLGIQILPVLKLNISLR